MASIANASKVYVAVGGGGTPLTIYDSANVWYTLISNNSATILWQMTDSSHIRLVGGVVNDMTINLPNNLTATGYSGGGGGRIFAGFNSVDLYGNGYVDKTIKVQ